MFYKDERLALFIDGSNLYAAAKSLGFDIDYKLLRQEFMRRGKLLRAFYYTALLENDDYSPMEFVVHVMERFFHKNAAEATRIMLHVHQNGVGECGVYTYEVAETKVVQVMDLAKQHQHPLQCVMEKK